MTSFLTSVEMNCMIFRYLQESGFTHTAFAFGLEAGISKSPIDGDLVPLGALVKFVQKGLQYVEMEANMGNAKNDVDEGFQFLEPLDIITKDVTELQKIVKDKRINPQKATLEKMHGEHEGESGVVKDTEGEDIGEKDNEFNLEHEGASKHVKGEEQVDQLKKEIEKKVKESSCEIDNDRAEEKHYKRLKWQHEDQSREMVTEQKHEEDPNQEENGNSGDARDVSATSTSDTSEIPGSDVVILQGHTSEVCTCAWSPSGSLLASGSGDSTARLWSLTDATSRSSLQSDTFDVLILKHGKPRSSEEHRVVTALDWNGEGTLLATGSYDGQTRIWRTNGELKSTLRKHEGAIFCLKWNKKGNLILTGSYDKSVFLWDVRTEELEQKFEFHSGPILDLDWQNNSSFATSSIDQMIYVCKTGQVHPVKSFSGHQDEVNCVKWDSTGSLLASCSDDCTVKIWSMNQDQCVHDLREHTKATFTIRWSPSGPGSNNPNYSLTLASASADSTVKLWDIEQGKLSCSLNGHRDSVYCLAFSPSGEYLASGSADHSVHIWSLKEGKIIRTFNGNGGIYEVCWNRKGDKFAAGFSTGPIAVLDFRM